MISALKTHTNVHKKKPKHNQQDTLGLLEEGDEKQSRLMAD